MAPWVSSSEAAWKSKTLENKRHVRQSRNLLYSIGCLGMTKSSSISTAARNGSLSDTARERSRRQWFNKKGVVTI